MSFSKYITATGSWLLLRDAPRCSTPATARRTNVAIGISAILTLACSGMTACHASSPAFRAAPRHAGQGASENQVFDANRQTPVRLLHDLYAKTKILVLSFQSHDYAVQYQLLDSLLREVGHDPRLKFIVLERSAEDAPILEEASTAALAVPDIEKRFSSNARAKFSLCWDGEWAYTWTEFFPHIRALNAQRPLGHKLLVTSIDGIDLEKAVMVPPHNRDSLVKILEGEHRETATSANMWKFLNTLGPSDKVIMLYNVAHVIKTFTDLNRQHMRVPANWMATFLRDHPEVESQISVVLLDGYLLPSWGSSGDLLTFSHRQSSRYPHQAFGVQLAPFREIMTERDTMVFDDSPSWPLGKKVDSPHTLPEMLDGVVLLPRTKPLGGAETYLPVPCGIADSVSSLLNWN